MRKAARRLTDLEADRAVPVLPHPVDFARETIAGIVEGFEDTPFDDLDCQLTWASMALAFHLSPRFARDERFGDVPIRPGDRRVGTYPTLTEPQRALARAIERIARSDDDDGGRRSLSDLRERRGLPGWSDLVPETRTQKEPS